jgi:hypothetical protein
MRKPAAVALGIAVGIGAELGALLLSFAGVNMFHGGEPRAIANVVLPGVIIVDHLSSDVASLVPKSLLILSLVQFPIYGALLGRDYARKSLSPATRAVFGLHALAAAVAFYGTWLDSRWQAASLEHASCVNTRVAEEASAAETVRIASLVKWIAQSKLRLTELREEKAHGATFMPDPEAPLVRTLAEQEAELEERWERYRQAGGTARSPEAVEATAGPCGKVPSKPYFF